MQIRAKITPLHIREALEAQKQGRTLESPLSVALERDGYKGASHSPNQKYDCMWAYDAKGERYLKIKLSKRAMTMLGAWWANKVCTPSTYILDATVDLVGSDNAKGDNA